MSRTIAATAISALLAVAIPFARAELNCNVGVEFHPGGGVKACSLNGFHQLYTTSGLVVRCADGARAEQYPDGRLRSCELAAELRTADETCPAGARVELEHDGTLRRCAER